LSPLAKRRLVGATIQAILAKTGSPPDKAPTSRRTPYQLKPFESRSNVLGRRDAQRPERVAFFRLKRRIKSAECLFSPLLKLCKNLLSDVQCYGDAAKPFQAVPRIERLSWRRCDLPTRHRQGFEHLSAASAAGFKEQAVALLAAMPFKAITAQALIHRARHSRADTVALTFNAPDNQGCARRRGDAKDFCGDVLGVEQMKRTRTEDYARCCISERPGLIGVGADEQAMMIGQIRLCLKLPEHRGGLIHSDIPQRRGKPLTDAACAWADFDDQVVGFGLTDFDSGATDGAADSFR
jgi:hypothetical protein